MEKHEWRERGESGLVFHRAEHHAGRWNFFTRAKDEEDWTRVELPGEADWKTLRDILWRKYQRRRCPWRMVEEIDKRIEAFAEPHE